MTMTYKALGTSAICEDGKTRKIMVYGSYVSSGKFVIAPDSYSSCRARVTIDKKTVYGYICVENNDTKFYANKTN